MKKWLIIGLVILLAGGAAVYLLIAKEKTPGNGNPPLTQTPATGTIQVPGGPKIKVVFSGPPELIMIWERLEADSFWQLLLAGTLKNVSSRTIIIDEIGFLLDGQQKAYWPVSSVTLKPGEEVKIEESVVGVVEKSKALEVKVLRYKAATLTPTTDQTVFTSAPANPLTPAEVGAAFFFLCDAREYARAEQHVTENFLNAVGSVENFWKDGSQGKRITKIEITKVVINGEEAEIEGTLYFSDGTSSSGPAQFTKHNDRWKMDW